MKSEKHIGRRDFMVFATLGSLGLLSASSTNVLAVSGADQIVRAKDALLRLKEGNVRFANNKAINLHGDQSWRDSLVAEQHPFAVIIGCSDSRVPVELVFDQGFGDLFVIRNAGNVIATDVLGTVEYAVAHLGVKLVVVMGHEGCGAVTAALMSEEEQVKEPIELQEVLSMIKPCLKGLPGEGTQAERVARAVDANVLFAAAQLRRLKAERKQSSTDDVRILGAVYGLKSGTVRFLDPTVDKV